MTGSLTIRKTSSGKEYYYIHLRYKNSKTGKWTAKNIRTGLTIKNNKKKAQAMIPEMIDKYSYLEESYNPSVSGIDPNITLCDYLDHWLKQKKNDVRQPTFEGYDSQVRRIQNYFHDENPKLTAFTPHMADVFFKHMLATGKINQKTGLADSPLSAKTVRSYKNLLYGVFTQARIDGLITANPVDGIVVRDKKGNWRNREYLFLTEEEVKELMTFISREYPQLLGIVFFGIYYGLRRSETLGLKWDAIDYEKKIVHIRHTVVRVKSICFTDQTKTDSSRRELCLFPTAEKCLDKIRQQQDADKAFFGKEYLNREGYIFCWGDGHTYDPNYISSLFRKAMRKFGRPEITLHKLRHTCASILIDRGWDIKKVQYWLGHEDVKTTLDIYAHYVRKKSNEDGNDMELLSAKVSGLFD